jgi:hypothetical protein
MSTNTTSGGGFEYTWVPGWGAQEGHHDGKSTAWAHHGIAVTDDDRIVTFSEKQPEVMILDQDGHLNTSWAPDVVEGHGLAVTHEDGREVLWISDIGTKNHPKGDGSYAELPQPARGAIVKYTLDGEELLRITAPELDVYRDASFSPAQVAVDSNGSGDIWVADPYGQALVLRFGPTGEVKTVLNGEEGAGRYAHPHSVFIDRRHGTPELLVADRRNKRIQVYTLEGEYLRSFGQDYFLTPGGFAQRGDYLFVTELDARITILDRNNEPVGFLGEDAGRGPGWPNALNESGAVVRPALTEGEFHSPHAAAFDSVGNLYLTEWLVGGRLDKLKVTSEPQGV